MLVIDDDMNILLTRGDSATIDLTIYNSDGSVYTPSGDDHVIFSVKKICSSPYKMFQIDNGLSTTFHITGDMTEKLTFGEYQYDVCLVNNTDVKTVVADKIFTVGNEVHTTWD